MPNEKFSSHSAKDEFAEDAPAMRVGPSQAPKAIAAVLVVGLAGAVAVHMWRASARTNVTVEAAELPTETAAEPAVDAESPTIEYDPQASLKQAEDSAGAGSGSKPSYAQARRKAAAATDARRLRVESVSVIGKQSSCVINGQRLTKGDVVDGFRVERFSAGAVVVTKGGFLFELRPPTTVAPPPSDRFRDQGWTGTANGADPREPVKKAGPTVWAPPEPPKRSTEPDDDNNDDDKWELKWGSGTRPQRVPRSGGGPMKSRSR